MKRRILAAALLLAMSLVPFGAQASSTLQARIAAQRAKAERLQEQLRQRRVQLHYAALKESDLQRQLHETNVGIGNVDSRIGELSGEERSSRNKLAWNTVQLNAAQRSLTLHDNLLKKRLVDIYENGDLSYAAVLLSAQSFSEFVERWEDLRLLIASNQAAVRARKNAEQRVAAVETSLRQTQAALESQEQDEQRARSQLGALASERQNLVAAADQVRAQRANAVAQLEELTATQEAELEQLIVERQREIEAQQESARRAAGIAGTVAPPSQGAPSSFSWPVTGTITSPYGWRPNPFGSGPPEFHPGLDIAAPSGTTITAAASGTVILARWYGGYGNFILIDHGGGVATGYGHCSAMYVSVGQQVQRGQAIGAVGMTGRATGPHVHFEIRINGKTVDPAPRLH